jgi:nucleotide-binding universal stress UspA family protein
MDEAPVSLVEAGLERDAEALTDRAGERLGTAGFDTVGTVCRGHPAETIVTHAAEVRADLVVVGTRGLSGMDRVLAGSVAGKVARYAPTSVLIARTAGPIREVLLGYDASPDADGALALVAGLPLRTEPRVTVCSVWDLPQPLSSGLAPTMVVEARDAYRDVARRAREAATAMANVAEQRLIARGMNATHRTAQGSAHEQLAIAASELPADLLVVGSHGLSAIQRFFMGSTSATLVSHPPTSVLVARREGDRA